MAGHRVGHLELLRLGHTEEQGELTGLGKKGGTQEQQEIRPTSHVRFWVSDHWPLPRLGLG